MMLANGFGMTVLEFLDDDMFLYENLNVEQSRLIAPQIFKAESFALGFLFV